MTYKCSLDRLVTNSSNSINLYFYLCFAMYHMACYLLFYASCFLSDWWHLPDSALLSISLSVAFLPNFLPVCQLFISH